MTTATNATAGDYGGPGSSGAELLDVRAVARLLSASPRTIYRLADAGKLPRPLKLGSLVRWRRDEIRRWIDAGCPAVRGIRGGAK